MPVEPSKPEWRAGTGAGQTKDVPNNATVPPLKPTTGGSEDTEEFRIKLGDLGNVPPFAPQGGGLRSFGDMASSLPFTSKPSENIPLKRPEQPKREPLTIPDPPKAPVWPTAPGMRPAMETLESYVRYFELYVKEWDDWSGKMAGHFWERSKMTTKEEHSTDLNASKRKMREKLGIARLDGQVRKRWMEECDKHDRRLEEYLGVLDKYGNV